MKRSRLILGRLWIALFVATGAALSLAEDSKLSPEGKARQSSHDFLFGEYAQGKELKFKGRGANRVLEEIVISDEEYTFTDKLRLELPAGSQRVAGMFRYLILRGEGLDHLSGLVMKPYAPKSNLAISAQQSDFYRVKVGSMPIPSDSMPPISIESKVASGEMVKITEVAFHSQGKLPTKFDDIPYRNLGEEFPRQKVRVSIDLQHELSIEGHIDLEREKFCRYYAAPGNLDSSFENWAAERNFLPGRQIFKIQPGLVVGYSRNQPKLKERSDKPGAADLGFFDRYDSGSTQRRTIPRFRDIRYAMCFNDYPEFMSVKQAGRGTPLVEHFDDAAELAAAFVADQIKDGGRTATWWEAKNESTIKSEWDYHWRADVDSWKLLADFHNRLADAVHEKVPGIKIGGPSSAWMQVQSGGFSLYQNQVRFMDLTKDHVDFYSHHFYEDFATLGAWERRGGKYTNYLLGRMEAILDMFRAHMHATKNIKPILITECGSLQPGRGPSDYWLRIRSYSAYMHKLMQRPEQIELAVPFAFMSIPWNPQSGDAAFIPKPGKPNNCSLDECDPTPLKDLFELWRDFDGRRLPVSHSQQWLDATAVYRENKLQVAMTNMGGRRLSVDLQALVGPLKAKSISQRRLFYRDGQVHYQDNVTHKDAARIPIDVEETTIVTLELENSVQSKGVVLQKTAYSGATAVKVGSTSAHECKIELDSSSSIANAKLVIGVARQGGLQNPLVGKFNGVPFKSNAGWAKEFNNLFASIKIQLLPNTLKPKNTVRIESQPGLVITSVNLVVNQLDD